jgi:DNA helicase-2/ATP-dependent DNA helicase PcrA
MTRARRELFLSHCKVREFRGQIGATVPSTFLRELPLDSLEVRDISQIGAEVIDSYRPAVEQTARPAATGFRLVTAAALTGADPGALPVDLSSFQPGVCVLHPEYGLGRIVAIEGAGPKRKGRVAFAVGSERTFVLAQSPLRTVGT